VTWSAVRGASWYDLRIYKGSRLLLRHHPRRLLPAWLRRPCRARAGPGRLPTTPFICVSGTIGEEATVELLKQGADDCVLKDRLSRLPFAVQRAIDEREHERGLQEAGETLATSETSYRTLAEASPDTIYVVDSDCRVRYMNGLAAWRFGMTATKEFVGLPLVRLFEAETGARIVAAVESVLASGQPYEADSLIAYPEGESWTHTRLVPLKDGDGCTSSVLGVTTDITGRKRVEGALRESILRQEGITEGVIAALARTVDVRDPSTAGHQRRVSELATAIARHMGLDERTARGVQVAGMLHDVGKINIPAEILSKPGRLSEIEFQLIKAHPRTAHEILEPIDFDFPLAEIVVQHHERLDGSGYPAGPSGEEILPEARILAVADVVEAMISDRPYRAALPLEEAMAELEGGSGSRYDAAACEAAIRLFREQGFAFSE
jgi:PAS domain S-box-containing protein/putative nucleotidyltransferase with HDIG domain